MSVLVKGMEMPKHCGECGIDWCNLWKKSKGNERHPHCPLVPVPPHVDLIGRECIIDIALHLMNTAKNDDIANGVKWLLKYIIDAPTIIEAEEEEC